MALIFVVFVLLWLGQTSAKVYSDGADALAIRAVLRADTSEVAAENLAGRIRAEVPGITIELINEAMGRSLLALQEPWISQMPDFEVTPLPILLEMRHPDLLTQPQKVAKFVEKLRTEPEIDFMAYNETAHDKLTKLADGTAAIQRHALRWTVIALGLAGFFAVFICARSTGRKTFPGTAAFVAGTWLGAFTGGAILFRWWESSAISSDDWQRINSSTYLVVAAVSMLIILAASALSYLLARSR